MSAQPALLLALAELDAELRATADVISREYPADDDETEEVTGSGPELPSRRRRALQLVEHEH